MQTGSAAEPAAASVQDLERAARTLAGKGDFAAAIAALSAANRIARQTEWERLLAHWRYLAYAQRPPAGTLAESWPAQQAPAFPGVASVPEIAAGQLSAAALAMGVQRHGALLVRGLLEPAQAEA